MNRVRPHQAAERKLPDVIAWGSHAAVRVERVTNTKPVVIAYLDNRRLMNRLSQPIPRRPGDVRSSQARP